MRIVLLKRSGFVLCRKKPVEKSTSRYNAKHGDFRFQQYYSLFLNLICSI